MKEIRILRYIKELIEKLSTSHQHFEQFVKKYHNDLDNLYKKSENIEEMMSGAIMSLRYRLITLNTRINDPDNGVKTKLMLNKIKKKIDSGNVLQEELTEDIKNLNRWLFRSRRGDPSSGTPLSNEEVSDPYPDLFPEIESWIQKVSSAIRENLEKPFEKGNSTVWDSGQPKTDGNQSSDDVTKVITWSSDDVTKVLTLPVLDSYQSKEIVSSETSTFHKQESTEADIPDDQSVKSFASYESKELNFDID